MSEDNQINSELRPTIFSGKNITTIIIFLIPIIFGAGAFYQKITNLSKMADSNANDIKKLNQNIHFITGLLQKDYKNIDISAYIDAASRVELTAEEAVKGLEKLKDTTPPVGKEFLMKKYGFQKSQVEAIFRSNDHRGLRE